MRQGTGKAEFTMCKRRELWREALDGTAIMVVFTHRSGTRASCGQGQGHHEDH